MGKPLIMMPSVTYALKGRQILASHGIRAEIERTPKHGENRSCGYSLYVENKTDEAEKILREHDIKTLGRTERENVP
ncbi:MAG: DUF3343 domain-containing protein [Acutalibacteraceae bacterium]